MAAKSLLRIPTFLLINLYLLTGMLMAIIAGGDISSWSFAVYFLACSSILAFWYINGSALNDIADVDIDKINLKGDKERPLVVRSADLSVVQQVAIGSAALALLISFELSLYHLAICGGLLLLNRLYSNKPARISRRGGLAPLLLPLGYVFLPFSLGYLSVTSGISSEALFVLGGLYLHFLSRIILKDYRDVKGDKAFGKKTFLLNRGNRAVCLASGSSLILSTALFFYGAGQWLGPFIYAYLILLFLGLGLLARLGQTESWKLQKPILAAFGRAMTGVTASIIFALLFTIEPIAENRLALLSFILAVVYAWSARQAFEYNFPGRRG